MVVIHDGDRAVLPEVLGADGLSQQLQPTDDALPRRLRRRYTVPTGSGLKAGSLAYATNGRAMVGVSVLGVGGILYQAAGAGTGCLVTWSGSAWQVAGTASTVSA